MADTATASRAAASGGAETGAGAQPGAEARAAAACDAETPASPATPQDVPDAPMDARLASLEAPPLRDVAQASSAERSALVALSATGVADGTAPNAAAAAPQAAITTEPPPPSTATPRPPPPPPARQVAQIAIALALGNGGAPRLTVALEPEELGRVEIRVERGAGDGEAARVRVVAERPETLALLQRDARQLDRALQGAGIAVAEGGMRFSLAGHEGGAAGGGAGNEGGGGTTRRGRDGAGAVPDAARPPVPTYRGAGLGLLDIAI